MMLVRGSQLDMIVLARLLISHETPRLTVDECPYSNTDHKKLYNICIISLYFCSYIAREKCKNVIEPLTLLITSQK